MSRSIYNTVRSTPLPEQPRIPTRELALSNTLVTLSNHLRAALAPAACGRGCAWGDEAYSTDALNEEGQLSGRRVSSPHTPSSFSPHPSPRREACRALSAAAAAQWVNNLSPVRGKILPYRRGAAEWRGTQRHRCVPCGQLLYSLPFLVLVQAPSELCLIGTRTFQGCFDTSISRPSFTETRITHRTRDTSNTCGHHAAPRMAPRRVSSWIYPSISDYSPQRGKRTCVTLEELSSGRALRSTHPPTQELLNLGTRAMHSLARGAPAQEQRSSSADRSLVRRARAALCVPANSPAGMAP